MDQKFLVIKSFISSSRRSRIWLIILLLLTFIAFVIFWNSRVLNWNMEIIGYLNIIERYQHDPASLSADQMESLQRALEKYGNEFIMNYNVEEVTHRLYNQTAPFAYVELPLTGVKFHVNDTGIICGWALVIIMLASMMSIRRLKENLEFMISEFQEEKFLLKIASMEEPWIMPGNSKVLSWINRIPYFLPLALLIMIFINDLLSKDLGMIISPPNMTILFSSTVLIIIILTWLTVSHFRLLKKIDEAWLQL